MGKKIDHRTLRKDLTRHNTANELAKKGYKYSEIALKLGITKQRVSQMIKPSNRVTIKVRRKEKRELLLRILINVKRLLANNIPVSDIRNLYKLSSVDIKFLYKKGVDLRIVKPEIIKKRRKLCNRLFKKGLTAYEITKIIPEHKRLSDVYLDVTTLNNGRLPKRINNTTKRGVKLYKEVARLKKKNNFIETYNILANKGLKNAFNGELRLETMTNAYYRWQKKLKKNI